MVRNPMTNEHTHDFSPSYEELLNELSLVNSRLTLDNISLKIKITNMQYLSEEPKTAHNK